MKTKLTFTLLAFTTFSFTTIRAEEILVDTDGDGYAETVVNLDQLDEASFKPVVKLCGGADDDQLMATTKLCGGMDDDQIVVVGDADFVKPVSRGLVSDPIGLFTSIQGPYQVQAPQKNGFTMSEPQYLSPANGFTMSEPQYLTSANGFTMSEPQYLVPGQLATTANKNAAAMSTDGGGWTSVTGDAGNDTLSDAMILQVMTTGSMVNSGGTASIFTNLSEEIVATSNHPNVTQIFANLPEELAATPVLHLSNSLYGGNGADTFVNKPVVNKGIESDPFGISGGSLDNLQTNQQIEQALLQLMSTGSLHGNDGDDTLWGGGGTDEVIVTSPSGGQI